MLVVLVMLRSLSLLRLVQLTTLSRGTGSIRSPVVRLVASESSLVVFTAYAIIT